MSIPERNRPNRDRGEGGVTPQPELDAITLASEGIARPLVPSAAEIAAYSSLADSLRQSASASLEKIRTVAELGFDLRARIEGDSRGGGAIAALTARQERGVNAVTQLRRAEEMIGKLYVESPQRILECVVSDFERRLAAKGVVLNGPYAAGGIAAALEETRFMVVFAGRALKSEDHVFGTIAGLKERSFAGGAGRDERPAPDDGERSADDRRASFEARQAARAKRSAERREALKSGGGVPVEPTAPRKGVDDEKAEVVAASAAQQRGVFEAAKPTEAQRDLLRQRPATAIRKMAEVVVGDSADAATVERFRVEITNDIAALLKVWLAGETALRAEQEGRGSCEVAPPLDVVTAQAREREFSREVESLRAVSVAIETDLRRIGRAVLKAKDSPSVRAAFSPAMIAAFEQLLEPPKSYETYELAD